MTSATLIHIRKIVPPFKQVNFPQFHFVCFGGISLTPLKEGDKLVTSFHHHSCMFYQGGFKGWAKGSPGPQFLEQKRVSFYKRTIKVCVSWFWRCSWTSEPWAAHLMVSLYLCSSGSNTQGKSWALEGRYVSSKKSFNCLRQR